MLKTNNHLSIINNPSPTAVFCLFPSQFSLLPFPFCQAATSTSVENPLQSGPIYAKQTQFQNRQNEPKFCYHRGLRPKWFRRPPGNKSNFAEAQMSVKFFTTKDYEGRPPMRNKSNQTRAGITLNPLNSGNMLLLFA